MSRVSVPELIHRCAEAAKAVSYDFPSIILVCDTVTLKVCKDIEVERK